jgi:hypothetical protein
MAINERLVHTASAGGGTGTGNQEEGLVLHLDANDVDSYDGDGDVWYDVHNHEYAPATNVSEHFNAVLYTGTSAINAITGVGFEPDLVWLKQRSNAQNHALFDTVRGANNFIMSNSASVKNTRTTDTLSSFDDDGFTLTAYSSDAFINYTGRTMVAWCFKAGGAASLNQGGGIDSQVSVNNDLGFSIATYTATGVTATVGHGLDSAPEMIIAKTTNQAYNWMVYHKDLGASNYLILNSRNAPASSSAFMNNTSPTSSVFTAGAGQNLNYANNDEIITYNFTSKRGVSKVSSYIGNGTTDNKIYTGFEPAFFMIKNTSRDNTGWLIKDNARGENSKTLLANSDAAEYNTTAYWTCDFERDGVRLTYGADNEFNRSGDTYIYYAVAKNTNAGSLTPSTDGVEVETDLIFDPTQVNYYGTYAFEQDNTVWKANSNKSNGQNEGEVYANNYFESGNTGKYYFEIKCLDSSGHGGLGFTDPTKYTGGNGASQSSFRNGQLWGLSSGGIQTGGYASSTTFANSTNTTGEVTAVAIDVATRKVWMGRVVSGSITWYNSGDPSGGTNPLLTLPSNYNVYQPLVFDGSWSGSSARYAFWKIHREAEASYLPTGFSYMKGAIKNADLELHLDASTYTSGSTWTDSSGNGNNGTITGTTFDSELGNYLNIASDSDYVDVSTANMLDSDFTIEMWYNISSTSSSYKMLLGGSGYQSQTGLGHYIYGDTLKTWVSISSSTTNVLTSPSALIANTWHHIVLRREGSTWTQYVDGNEVGTATGTTTSLSSANSRIGRHYNSTGLFAAGKSGQVRIYSSALTQNQIRQNFNYTKPKYPNVFHGDITGATWNASGYFDFDGSNDNVDITGNPLSVNNFTYSAWFNADTVSVANQNIITSNAGHVNYGLQVTGTGLSMYSLNSTGGAEYLVSSTGLLSAGTWYHVAYVKSSSSGHSLYLNGAVVASDSSFTGNCDEGTLSETTIGSANNNIQWFNGKISKVKAYSKVLTQSEITALYNEGY